MTNHPQKITLKPYMITNESAQGDAALLIDEQEIAGDPANGKGGTPSTRWTPNHYEFYYPISVMFDLGTTYELDSIYLYSGSEAGKVTVSTGVPFHWEERFTDPLGTPNQWNEHRVRVKTRYVRVTIESQTAPAELVMYGTPLGEPEPVPEPVHHERPTMDQFIGINGFKDDPMDILEVGGFLREYHSWKWVEGNAEKDYEGYPNNKNAFNPCYDGFTNYDEYYRKLKEMGVTVCPCIKENVLFMTDYDAKRNHDKPLRPGLDPANPFSYIEHADHMFQYAARYGGNKVEDHKLKLREDQERLSGLGYLEYYENWNEQNCWWMDGKAYFTPYEYAAMASADCDGHQGKMGDTYGVKNADPHAKLVMGGIATMNVQYLKAMKLWADYHRGGELPFDVMNVHHYSNDFGGQQGTGTVGYSPERDGLRERMEELVDYRNRYLPGKELWITEFGYDTNDRSPQRAPRIGNYSNEEVQGQWLVRSYLALAAAGADKAAMYMIRDVNPESTGQFGTSGLVSSPDTGKARKLSWYYVYSLRNTLSGMRYHGERQSHHEDVLIYEFKYAAADRGALVLWCKTENETIIENYVLELPRVVTSVTKVEMIDKSTTGKQTELVVDNGKVRVTVSERPIFILLDTLK